MNDGPDTLKIPHIEEMNELDYVEHIYQQAMNALLTSNTWANRKAFEAANERLVETRWAYRQGAALLRAYQASHGTYTHLGAT